MAKINANRKTGASRRGNSMANVASRNTGNDTPFLFGFNLVINGI